MPYEAKTDWNRDDIVRPEDMNRIEQGIKDAFQYTDDKTANIQVPVKSVNNKTGDVVLDADDVGAAPKEHNHDASAITSGTIAAERLPLGSTSAAGIVQLSAATNGTRTSVAATESAVKAAYDEALAAKQSGVDAKNQIVGAINSKGGNASTNYSWATLTAAIQGLQQAKGDLALTSAFFDMLGNYNSISTMFIKKDNNIVLIKQTSSGAPPKFQSELHEVSPNGTVVRVVHLGAPQALPPRSFAVGDDVVLVTTEDPAGNGFYEVYDHAGTLISKSQVSYLDVFRTHAITRDGSNIFIALSDNPLRVVNQSGTAYFTMPDGSGDAREFVFLSKTKLYVALAREGDSPISRKHTLITRDGLSFSYAMAARWTEITGIVNFLGAHAYR
ncbi:phage tail protein [Bacillus cereus]|uniref:phage tail protein n=1 Tax=Paenibacillus melissococcoides TaxID=2912268 RepID=UPI002DC0A6C8|nr:phage tail protein [Bacillus cereus]